VQSSGDKQHAHNCTNAGKLVHSNSAQLRRYASYDATSENLAPLESKPNVWPWHLSGHVAPVAASPPLKLNQAKPGRNRINVAPVAAPDWLSTRPPRWRQSQISSLSEVSPETPTAPSSDVSRPSF
jgi:hypothetical protein